MLEFLGNYCNICLVTLLVLVVAYFKFLRNKSKNLVFLKDKDTLRATTVSSIKKISHDTIKITLDFPNINCELGLPLGKLHFPLHLELI